MKLRYKIVLIDLSVTLLYFIAIRMHFQSPDPIGIDVAIDKIVDSIIFIALYNWINIIWLVVIMIGLISEKRKCSWAVCFQL
jgi:hypothetical protein